MNMESTPAPSSALPSRACPRCLSPIPERAPGGLCPRCLLDGANAPTDAGLGAQAWKTPTLAEIASAFPELEVLGHLGTGGMGCVYRVRERDSGRISALKVLPRELAADPAFVERFEREARTLSRLRHPHIVGVHGFGQAGGFCFLLMEFVDGANLRQALRSGRFTPQQALALIPPICEALQAAHAQGVLHRDIKPENLLLDAEGRVKIADFGIAKLLEGPGASAGEAYTLTRTGARIGTPHYMAPEQVETPEQVDHRADIYSLGVVFYELLTGELPLGRFPAPSIKAGLNARVDDIVFRALAKERELRQQSADQVRAEVEGLAGTERQEKAMPSKRVPWTRWKVAWAIAIALLAAWILPGITSWLFQERIATNQRVNRLKHLGLMLRTAGTADLASVTNHVFMTPELLTDPQTGKPILILGTSVSDLSPGGMLAVSPPYPYTRSRSVLLGDGSVQQISEEEFLDHLSRASPSVRASWGRSLRGSRIHTGMALPSLIKGGTLVLEDNKTVNVSDWGLAAALEQLSGAKHHSGFQHIYLGIREGGWDPNTKFVFLFPSAFSKHGPDVRIVHWGGRFSDGGLLALLAVLAARENNAEALEWALNEGKPFWKDRERLVFFCRQMYARGPEVDWLNLDQAFHDWEEIGMRTAEVLALKPGSSPTVTVFRHTGVPGQPSRQIDWP
jgi:serine/threonine protein kinase